MRPCHINYKESSSKRNRSPPVQAPPCQSSSSDCSVPVPVPIPVSAPSPSPCPCPGLRPPIAAKLKCSFNYELSTINWIEQQKQPQSVAVRGRVGDAVAVSFAVAVSVAVAATGAGQRDSEPQAVQATAGKQKRLRQHKKAKRDES